MTTYIDGAEADGRSEASVIVPKPGQKIEDARNAERVKVKTIADVARVRTTRMPTADSVTMQGRFVAGGLIALAVQSFEQSPKPTWRLDGIRRFKVAALGMVDDEVVVIFAALKGPAAA